MRKYFECVYMVRRDCEHTIEDVCKNYEPLLWSSSYRFIHTYKPEGVQVEDLYQVGRLGILEALYIYRESRCVVLPRFIQVCVDSEINRLVRTCRGKGYMLLDTRMSLDLSVSEDNSLRFIDLAQCENRDFNPYFYANMYELKITLDIRLATLSDVERLIYNMWNEGYSYEEMAKATNTNRKRIDNVIQKIKRLALNPS